jgi:hypothetical protein
MHSMQRTATTVLCCTAASSATSQPLRTRAANVLLKRSLSTHSSSDASMQSKPTLEASMRALASCHPEVTPAIPALVAYFGTVAARNPSSHQHPHSARPDANTAAGSPNLPAIDHMDHKHTLHDLVAALNPRSHMTTSTRIRNIAVALIGVLVLSTGVLYIFRDQVKDGISKQTADVAKRSIVDQGVQQQVNELSSDVVQKLLNDPVIMSNCLSFLQTLFASPETRQSLATLLQATLKDPATQDQLSVLASELLKSILDKPDTLTQLTQLLRKAIMEPGNEQALTVLFKKFVDEPETQVLVAGIGLSCIHLSLSGPITFFASPTTTAACIESIHTIC